MTEQKALRLSKVAKELNVGLTTIVEFLHKKGVDIGTDPNAKITSDVHDILLKEYSPDIHIKKESDKLNLEKQKKEKEQKNVSVNDLENKSKKIQEEDDNDTEEKQIIVKDRTGTLTSGIKKEDKPSVKVVGKIDLESEERKPKKQAKHEEPVVVEEKPKKTTAKKTKKEEDEEKEKQEIKETKESKGSKKEVAKTEIVKEKEPKEEISEVIKPVVEEKIIEKPTKPESDIKVVGKIDLDSLNQKTRPDKKPKAEKVFTAKKEDKPVKEQVNDSNLKEEIAFLEKEEELAITEIVEDIVVDKDETKRDEFYRDDNYLTLDVKKLSGPSVVSKIDLAELEKRKRPVGPVITQEDKDARGKRKRIKKDKKKVKLEEDSKKPKTNEPQRPAVDNSKKPGFKKVFKPQVNVVDVEKQIKDTLAKLTSKGKSKGSRYRKEKREAVNYKQRQELEQQEIDKQILQVTEFVTVSEIASMMNVQVNEVISACMSIGLFVSINQRLDAETIVMVAENFGFSIEFTTVEVQESIKEEIDKVEDLLPRPPVVTVMGHVDHGKTKLLDYIRQANVVAGEAGGITQHIGAYSVKLENGQIITFLDTPGHEAFTAMRARGAKVTDISIIVVAADDGVKPQTIEAINHAQAAGVPIVIAINKIDKPAANPDKVKEELAQLNILVESWGGKYQSQEISAKTGLGIKELLDKVMLESEILELKANPNRRASGTVIESSLDKGRGYVSTMLVQTGTLRVGDVVLAGPHTGRVKVIYNERNSRISEAGPSTPILILGLDGAPQAGDLFNVMESEKEARDIANKRMQLQREQGMRARKHITLDEIGRRLAIGNFKELNIIVKGDVDGSVEALSDSLIKLSNEEIQVKIVHKAVGQISESDVLLAAASNAIVVGFQVRPSFAAKKLAEQEEIDIRLYSIIYDAIDEIKAAMEGMLSPEIKEEILATLEIHQIFKVTKVGTIAGCIAKDGKITRDARVRLIRDGIVVYTGKLGSLKRFKDDVKEVTSGQECGLNIENYNDIKVGDFVEAFKETEVRKTL